MAAQLRRRPLKGCCGVTVITTAPKIPPTTRAGEQRSELETNKQTNKGASLHEAVGVADMNPVLQDGWLLFHHGGGGGSGGSGPDCGLPGARRLSVSVSGE